MKKFLILLVAALSLAACAKDSDVIVRYTPRAINLDRALGGSAVVTARTETYPEYVVPMKLDDYESIYENIVYFWKGKKPTAEELRSRGEYEAHGCKITLSDDFKQYTIEVEKDCEWDYLEVWTRWVNGYLAPSAFYIVLNPELYDNFRK